MYNSNKTKNYTVIQNIKVTAKIVKEYKDVDDKFQYVLDLLEVSAQAFDSNPDVQMKVLDFEYKLEQMGAE